MNLNYNEKYNFAVNLIKKGYLVVIFIFSSGVLLIGYWIPEKMPYFFGYKITAIF